MRKKVVRFQLVLLAVLAILVVSRVFKGLPALDGQLTIIDIDAGELAHQGFVVDRDAAVTITAYGSLEREQPNPVVGDLAAFPWIVRRADRSLIWQMDPARSRNIDGTLVKVEDTVMVEAGTYDLFFASFGVERPVRKTNPFSRLAGHWSNDRKNWQVALRVRGEDGGLRPDDTPLDQIPPPQDGAVVWSSGPMRGHQSSEQLFSITAPTRLAVYSIGEFCNGESCDTGWIENLESGDRVWKLSEENSVFAGGSKSNRVFHGFVEVDAGNYRAVYRTDSGHSFGNWYGNPPFDPLGWGITVAAPGDSQEHIRLYDLWSERDAFVRMTSVRDDEHRTTAFRLSREVPIVAYAQGELRSSGSRYDYGWIEDDRGNSIWQMSYGASSRAGGDDDNRAETAFLILKPGRYVAHYVSDGSHSFEGWNRGKPTHPERWGLTLFLVREADADAVEVEPAGAPPASPAAAVIADESVLVDITRVGNDADLTERLVLEEDAELRIRAYGEITSSGRYDYAWIEDDDGDVVWEMTRGNTTARGSGDRLRQFDGAVTLPAGTYRVRYVSDFSYAFGDFQDDSPARPYDYGIVVARAVAAAAVVVQSSD